MTAKANGAALGSVGDRIGPGFRRCIRDIYQPDAAGDERLDDLIEQLRELPWPTRTRPSA